MFKTKPKLIFKINKLFLKNENKNDIYKQQ